MITPRATRLVRSADLGGFRAALVSLACDGGLSSEDYGNLPPEPAAAADPLAARHRLVIVPTRGAAAHLLRTIEHHRVAAGRAVILPEFVTPGELPARFAERLPALVAPAAPAQREVLLGVACRRAAAAGVEPPFRLRPGLVAEILRFYDTMRRHGRDVDTFERLALGALQPGAEHDRGADRLVRQTRFLVAAFREFEVACAAFGIVDEHLLRRELLQTAAPAPWRHAVVAVGDRARDVHGLHAADWDLLARVPGLQRLDIVTTDTTLAGAFHERLHDLLPGIEEVRFGTPAAASPRVRVAEAGGYSWIARDREEEVAGFARWVRAACRHDEAPALDSFALVVRQPLPYVYLAREVLRSAGIASQTYDALPLAAEPYAAAFDLVCAFVSGSFARVPAIALLRSPHFRFGNGTSLGGAVPALDRALSEAGYLGEHEALVRLVDRWQQSPDGRGLIRHALPAAQVLLELAGELAVLREPAPISVQLERLLAFLERYDNVPGPDDPLRTRQLRARGAIRGIMTALRDAYAAFDQEPAEFDTAAALVRRWIEAHTFAPRTGDAGVHVVDADSARFGEFACVQLAGVVDGEWPDRPARTVFYSAGILRDLGWPPETERLDAARASFVDLLQLPSAELAVSAFALEHDSVVAGSTLLEEVERAGLDATIVAPDTTLIFDYEALAAGPAAQESGRNTGATTGHAVGALSLSALERYQDCPFKFFAADVLRLDEVPEDEPALSPRARGRFIHEVFQRFFHAWDARATAASTSFTITPDRIDDARALFAEVAEGQLAQLPESDAALERARLFGSAIVTGIVDVVLGIEAGRAGDVRERWLEYRLEGEFLLGGDRPVTLRGVADRIDLLEGNRLRVIDYKTGSAPKVNRALQVPIYALCAQERLSGRDAVAWEVEEAAYVAFSGKRALVPVVRGDDAGGGAILDAARARLLAAVDGISRGEFPPRPHDPIICSWCAYASVCRKDYVGDE